MQLRIYLHAYIGCLFHCTVMLCASPVYSQEQPPPDQPTNNILVRKNFPLLWHFQQNRRLGRLIEKDTILAFIAAGKHEDLTRALNCADAPECYAKAVLFKESEQNAFADEIVRLYNGRKAFRKLAVKLRADGSYALYENLPDTAMLRRAGADVFAGLNRMIEVYLLGTRPRYDKIDSISFSSGDTTFYRQVHNALEVIQEKKTRSFFEIPLRSALSVMDINGRNEAARYEPMASGDNSLPFKKLPGTDWGAYKYSLILVPGLGPETPGVRLDSGAISRLKDGAIRFRQGAAPFIVVSGGNVHPFKTPYNEAVEMKKYLVSELKIPNEAIFIEPHARHTTTNLRNTNRIIYNFAIPADKPVLIVTDTSQTNYISGNMDKTAIRDLQYIPYTTIKKLNDKETEYYPVRTSLHGDPSDPLDP